jgi:hypothetical protein
MILVLATRDFTGKDFNKVLKKNLLEPITEIVLMNEYEFQYTSFAKNGFEYLIDFANIHNISIRIVNGSRDTLPILYDSSLPRYNVIKEIIYWPTSFFTDTVLHVDQYNLSIAPIKFGKKYTFISLNRNAHDHRCLMMDLLAKHDLLKNQAISWHGLYYSSQDNRYKFKYWEETPMHLTERVNGDHINIFTNVIEYDLAFLELVNESTENIHFLTEKTVKPLLFGKPFIIFGAIGFHEWLKDLGFLLYDEIFDYSFDYIEDTVQRFEHIITQVKNIDLMNSDERYNLFLKIKEKLEYNRQHAIEIATDPSLIPAYVNFLYNQSEGVKIYNHILDNIMEKINV